MMKKFNVNKETVGKIAKKGCAVVLYGIAAVLPYISVKDTINVIRYSGNVGYGDVVDVIMNSDMLSSYRKEAIEVLPKDGDSELYKSIIAVVQSDMMSSYRVETIKNICKG